jgi:GR25 family glycosyltransferase involved in LPS biosynthesis
MNSISTYIILLERDKKRVAHVENSLKPHLENGIVYSAFDYQKNDIGEFLKENNLTIKYNSNLPKIKLLQGQLSCLISHYSIWKEIIEKNIEETIILEDDASINATFNKQISKIRNELPDDYDITYLYYNKKIIEHLYPTFQTKITKQFKYIMDGFPSYGTVGYIISNKGATKLLKHFKTIYYTVDNMIADLIAKGKLKSYASKTIIVNTIGDTTDLNKNKLPSNIWNSRIFS